MGIAAAGPIYPLRRGGGGGEWNEGSFSRLVTVQSSLSYLIDFFIHHYLSCNVNNTFSFCSAISQKSVIPPLLCTPFPAQQDLYGSKFCGLPVRKQVYIKIYRNFHLNSAVRLLSLAASQPDHAAIIATVRDTHFHTLKKRIFCHLPFRQPPDRYLVKITL